MNAAGMLSSRIARAGIAALAGAALAAAGAVQAQTIAERIKGGQPVLHAVSNDAPYGFVGKDGRITGIEVEIVSRVLKEMGGKSETSATTFGSLIPGIQARRFQVASGGIYIRPERCKVVRFSQPSFMIGVGAFTKKGAAVKATTLNELAQYKDLKFGKLTGGFESEAFGVAGGDKGQITDFSDRTAMAAAVKAGRIDVGLMTALGAAAAVNNDEGLELITPLAPPMLDGKPFVYYAGLAFSKEDDAFVDEFDKHMTAFVQSPAYRELLAEYKVPADVIPPASVDIEAVCRGER